jgi:hypothetical protein
MKKLLSILPRWLPALVVMIAIFSFSGTPGNKLPNFFDWDYVIKKTGHMVGYGLLALSYLHFFRYQKKYFLLSWFLAILFSFTDEFHQWYIPGRHASLFDTLVFDNIGAIAALWLYRHCEGGSPKQSQSE